MIRSSGWPFTFSSGKGALYDAATNRIFVANDGDGTLQSFDSSSLTHLKTSELGDDADNLTYDTASKLVWVGYGSGGLASFDADLNRLADIKPPTHPESFQLEPDYARLFGNLPRRLKISVIDRGKRAIIANWHLSGAISNFPMALDAANQRLMVGCRIPARMPVINTKTGKVVAKAPIVGDTDDLFFDGARHLVYVIGGEGAVDVFRQRGPDHYELLSKIATVSCSHGSVCSHAERAPPCCTAPRIAARTDSYLSSRWDSFDMTKDAFTQKLVHA